MNKINIDKAFFNLDFTLSKGLISGLKKLIQKGFIVTSDELDLSSNPSLKKILELEGIEINQNPIESVEKDFLITTENLSTRKTGLKAVNCISVSEKSNINNFEDAVNEILKRLRTSSQHRKTKETDIKINLSLDGNGESKISTGIGFFNHMLEQIAKHSNINLNIDVKGDLHVDEHHTVEDIGITLGNALNEALGNKKGIKRYGFFLPMDDSIAQCTIDLGGRTYLNFKCKFERESVGKFPTELTEEFFRGLASGLKANIYIRAKGKNDHHKMEAIFKAFAKALNEACRLDERNENSLPSTKGIL